MVSQLEIQARIERYGLLRSALRALEASSPDAGSFGLEESFQQIRGWLRELRTSNADTLRDPSAETQVDGIEQVSSAQIAHLDNLDRKLEQLQTAIVAQIRSIRLSQLRATLPAVKRQNPEELKALFDLCLIAHDSDSPWWSLIDYMITLLACEEKGGRRYVARDPTRLTPRLDELCAACDREKNDLTDALVHMFHRARVDLERGNPAGPIIEKMRSAKHQAMETLLIPDLLRAITAYNIAVSNQRSDLIETQRVLEKAELESFEKSLGAKPPAQEPTPRAPVVVPFGGSALDSLALREIVEAIRRRLLRQEPEGGPESEIAAALDLSRLSAYEESAFRGSDRGPVMTLVSTAVTVGLIENSLGELGDRLAGVGISAEQLQADWVQELENKIGTETQDLVSDDAYEEARRIAEVRTRLLSKPEEDVNAWQLERGVELDAPRTYDRAKHSAPPPRKPAPRKRRVRVGTMSGRQVVTAIALAGVLAIGASMYFTGGTNSKVAFYSERQLEVVSPHIESGYRNGRGEGPAFVGTLRPQWDALSAAEREASAHAIEAALLEQGISEFMFFDERRQLKLRYTHGRLAIH
jgi:hypothetical protein